MLFGREAEIRHLTAAWDEARAGQPRLVVLYGRRQVGKTTLARTFLDEHVAADEQAYVAATLEGGEPMQLRRFNSAMVEIGGSPDATTWSAALDFLRRADRPVAVVIDEVPYLESATPGWTSVVQAIWDDLRYRPRPVLLILTGSALSMIRSMLSGGGPLFQRVDLEIALEPFDLPTAAVFIAAPAGSTAIEAYAACGGYPGLLRRWDATAPAEENLARLAFDSFGPVLQTGHRVLAELPAAGAYRRAMVAIGQGASRYAEIVNLAGQRVEQVIADLDQGGYVRRSVPLGQPVTSKRAIYEIADPFVRFWFAVLHSQLQIIESGQGRQVLPERRHAWQQHLGWVFEEQARLHAVRMVSDGELAPGAVVGRWWMSKGQQVEIDVLGMRNGRTVLVGEAKWSARAPDFRLLRDLDARARRAPKPATEVTLAYWGRARASVEVGGAGLVSFTPDDMVHRAE